MRINWGHAASGSSVCYKLLWCNRLSRTWASTADCCTGLPRNAPAIVVIGTCRCRAQLWFRGHQITAGRSLGSVRSLARRKWTLIPRRTVCDRARSHSLWRMGPSMHGLWHSIPGIGPINFGGVIRLRRSKIHSRYICGDDRLWSHARPILHIAHLYRRLNYRFDFAHCLQYSSSRLFD